MDTARNRPPRKLLDVRGRLEKIHFIYKLWY